MFSFSNFVAPVVKSVRINTSASLGSELPTVQEGGEGISLLQIGLD